MLLFARSDDACVSDLVESGDGYRQRYRMECDTLPSTPSTASEAPSEYSTEGEGGVKRPESLPDRLQRLSPFSGHIHINFDQSSQFCMRVASLHALSSRQRNRPAADR